MQLRPSTLAVGKLFRGWNRSPNFNTRRSISNLVAANTPANIPLHWQEQLKKDLLRDERLGVIERVPTANQLPGVIEWLSLGSTTTALSARLTYHHSTNTVSEEPTAHDHHSNSLVWARPTHGRPSPTPGMVTTASPSVREQDRHLTTFITSDRSIGYYLSQKHCDCTPALPGCCYNGWRIALAGSRFLSSTEKRYAADEGEMLGVAWVLSKQNFYPRLPRSPRSHRPQAR